MKYRSKLIFIVVMAVFALFFTNDFGLVNIKKSAIIIALAIDMEEDEYKVSAQIILPLSTAQEKGSSNAILSGQGKTVATAIEMIGVQSGWFPKLNFCHLIILSNSTISNNVFDTIDFFLREENFQDSALIVASEGEAVDLLTASSPFDEISSFALQKILLKDSDKTSGIALTTVKNFAIKHFSLSEANYIPLVKLVEEENPTKPTAGSADEKKEKFYTFDATNTIILKDHVAHTIFDSEQTIAFNLSQRPLKNTQLLAKDVEIDGKKANCLVEVGKQTTRKHVKIINNIPTLFIKIHLDVKIKDTNTSSSIAEITRTHVAPEPVKEKIKENLTNNLTKIFEDSQKNEIDIFYIHDAVHKFNYKYYNSVKDSINSSSKLVLDIKVNSI